MRKRANSFIRKMEILQFCLLTSDLVWRGRILFFAINSNRFGKPWTYDQGGVEWDESGNEVPRIRKEVGPSRKIFRIYLKELLEEKLLTRIQTRDRRSKYYSITPLGIIHLIKFGEDRYYFDHKYRWPERIHVIFILQTFAQPNVKSYKSIIFEKEKFINYDTNLWDDLSKWVGFSLRNLIPHVFSNVELTQEQITSKHGINMLEFFVTNGYYENKKFSLARFDFEDKNFIKVSELDRPISSDWGLGNTEYKELKLDDEQFHHYLANLMLCSLIYDYGILLYDLIGLGNKRGIKRERKTKLSDHKRFKADMKDVPEYFLRILFLFLKHILRLTKQQYELNTGFKDELNDIQFVKN